MYTMHLFEKKSKKATVITEANKVECFLYLVQMNNGIRKTAQEEPSWDYAYGYEDGNINNCPIRHSKHYLNI